MRFARMSLNARVASSNKRVHASRVWIAVTFLNFLEARNEEAIEAQEG
jgi:hypothetical protein